MTDGATVKLGRKGALFAKLRRARPTITRELVKAVNKSAQQHAAMSQTLAPEDEGHLRNSIVANPATNTVNPAATVTAGDEKAFYAPWVEFGTPGHEQGGAFEGSDHPGVPAQPFMFPAYRLLRQKSTRRIARAIATGIRRGTV